MLSRFALFLCVAALAIAGCLPKHSSRTVREGDFESLHAAAATGDEDAVRRLIDSGADVTEADAEGATPLHLAAFGGHTAIIQLLLDAGGRLLSRDHFGFTPLHAAAREGHLDAVKLLVERGADLEARDENGLTATEVARMMGHKAVADWLASRMAKPPGPAEEPTLQQMEPEPEPEPPPPIFVQKVNSLLTGESFRVWTSARGEQVEAEFLQNILDVVTLRRRDATIVQINLNALSAEDQALVRQLSRQVPPILAREERASATRQPSLLPETSALRLASDKQWTILQDCRLLHRRGNDGDSFHVLHDGKEYIFRLYFVDAPESVDTFGERVRDQADYFHIDEEDVLRLGEEAKRFTARILSRAPFTAITRWEDAKGNSRLPRFFAFVVTSQGDLDELLVAEGLARLHGMRIEGSWALRKLHRLEQLEAVARRQRAGGWGILREARVSRP